jgi:beta-lactamase class D
MKFVSILYLSILFLFQSKVHQQDSTVRSEFKKYYDEYNVEGSFALYNQNENKYLFYNKDQFEQPFTPASTFKILNSLIGLEAGVIEDEHTVIEWDGVERNTVWDQDHDLQLAYQNSAVWYYQELARRVGEEVMAEWVDKVGYGNEDIGGGIDQFWLYGNLRISPKQQIDFLRMLHDEELPFSDQSIQIVKKIMVETDTTYYTLRSKTGWGYQDGKEIGWYVGYVDTGDNVYFFTNCTQINSEEVEEVEKAILFDKARKEISQKILKELGII